MNRLYMLSIILLAQIQTHAGEVKQVYHLDNFTGINDSDTINTALEYLRDITGPKTLRLAAVSI